MEKTPLFNHFGNKLFDYCLKIIDEKSFPKYQKKIYILIIPTRFFINIGIVGDTTVCDYLRENWQDLLWSIKNRLEALANILIIVDNILGFAIYKLNPKINNQLLN